MKNIYFPDRDITFDDLKFVCYMIERTARRCKQPNAYIVEHIGKDELKRNLSLADVLHSENPEDVADRWESEYHLEKGTTDVLNTDTHLQPFRWVRCMLVSFFQLAIAMRTLLMAYSESITLLFANSLITITALPTTSLRTSLPEHITRETSIKTRTSRSKRKQYGREEDK